ncbi:hypothetical protein J1614_006738 [Plenodomus biglobosus]|nr:hypothetical protein J1614_006738 [Plenodomus biglobosus]
MRTRNMHSFNPSGSRGQRTGLPLLPQQSINASDRFSREEVQNMLNAAQERARIIYHDRPLLCRALQDSFRKAFGDCYDRQTRFHEILLEQLEEEWWIMDDYNQFRYISDDWQSHSTIATEALLGPVPDIPHSFLLRSLVAPYNLGLIHRPLSQGPPTSPIISNANAKNAPPTQKKSKKDRVGECYDKLGDAPSMLLRFPDGNITLAEICAFLPQSIKSWDVIDRLIWNGVTTVTLVTMINHFRDMPRGKIENSATYRMMKGQIGHRAKTEPAYRGWTVGNHCNIPKPSRFDHGSVSVAHFRIPYVSKAKATTAEVLFRDLANGVKVWPSGYDTLDLTRCVRYCVDHPEEDWYYPSHFAELLAGLPQDPPHRAARPGPATVYYEHTDAASVERHTSSTALKGAKETYTRKRDGRGRLLRKEMPSQSNVDWGVYDKEHSFDPADDNNRASRAPTRHKRDADTAFDVEDIPATKHQKLSEKALGKRPVNPSAESPEKRPVRQAVRPRHLREITLADLESESESESEPEAHQPSPKRKAIPHSPDVDSDSESDTYHGPKRQKKVTGGARRKSGRVKRFGSSYNVVAALEMDEEESICPSNGWGILVVNNASYIANNEDDEDEYF